MHLLFRKKLFVVSLESFLAGLSISDIEHLLLYGFTFTNQKKIPPHKHL